jgi:hypothetical protein
MTQPLLQKLARIDKTFIGLEDHGILTAYLQLSYDSSSSQSTPMYDLRGPKCGEFLEGLLDACGVHEWSKLPGLTIYALMENDSYHSRIVGIEPLPFNNGKRFLFQEVFPG